MPKGARTSSRKSLGSIHPPPPAFVSHCHQTAYCPDSSWRSSLRQVEKASIPGQTRRKRELSLVKWYQLANAFAVVKSRRGRKPSSGRKSRPARAAESV